RARIALTILVEARRRNGDRGLPVVIHRYELVAKGQHAAAAVVPGEHGDFALAAAVADQHPLGLDERDQPIDLDILGQQLEYLGIAFERADAALAADELAEQRREIADIGAD